RRERSGLKSVRHGTPKVRAESAADQFRTRSPGAAPRALPPRRRIIFYDSNDSSIGPMAERRASELNATAIAIESVKKLSDEFQRLKSTGVKVDRMLFYTHGDPGGVHFGSGVLTAKRLDTEFGGKDCDFVFAPGA